MPFAIVKVSTGEVIQRFGTLPASLDINGQRVISPVAVGDQGLGYRLVDVVEVNFAQPGLYYMQGPDTPVLNGNTLTITRQWNAWTQPQIDAYVMAQHDGTATDFDNADGITRALALAILDQFNSQAATITAILNAIDGAATLAALKTAVLAIADQPQRTPAQLRNAVRAKLGA